MSSQELHFDGAEQGDRRERMAVSVAGSEPSFQILEERKESKARENRPVLRELGQLKRKLQQLEKRVERCEGREAKKRKRCGEMEVLPSRCLQLKFTKQPPLTIFTMAKVKAADTKNLHLELYDTETGKVLVCGPESSMNVELVPVNGDVMKSETSKWTPEYIEENIITEREDKPPLLSGKVVKLNGGSGEVADLKITDNSSWVRSGRFRLVARVANGFFNGVRVKEAITDAFRVKDKRGKLCEKPCIPQPKDPVWKLEGIAEKGPYRQSLDKLGIVTVEGFLKSLTVYGNGLKDRIGMKDGKWEATLRHAEKCILSGAMNTQPISNELLIPVSDIAQSKKTTGMRTNSWEDAAKHAKRCTLTGERILRPTPHQQFNHVYDAAQPKKVGKQQSIQAVSEPHEVVDGSLANEPIDSIPGGSSKPEIQQQHISSRAFADGSDIGGKYLGVAWAQVGKQQSLQAVNEPHEVVVGSSANEPIDSIAGGSSKPEVQQQHISSRAFAESSDMGGKYVGVSWAQVGKQQSLQAVNEPHEVVVGSSANEPIDSIPGGSSKPEIRQQHISSRAFAESSDMGGKYVGVAGAQVGKQKSLQAVNEPHELVVGGPANELIDSIPGASSKPEIQQQHISSRAFAESSDMGGKYLGVAWAQVGKRQSLQAVNELHEVVVGSSANEPIDSITGGSSKPEIRQQHISSRAFAESSDMGGKYLGAAWAQVGRQQSLQAVNELHEVVVGSSANEPIDSITGGSSKPEIRQQHISSRAFADSSDLVGKYLGVAWASGDALENFPLGVTCNPEVNSQAITDGFGLGNWDMGGINVGFPSTLEDASENFGLDAILSSQVKLPATHVNPFYSQCQEKDSLELGFEDTPKCVWSFDFDHDPKPLPERKEDLGNMTRNSIDTQGRVNVSSAAGFPNISAGSTRKNERAPKNFR